MDETKVAYQTTYRNLNPAKPLDGSLLDAYYVQRPGAPVRFLSAELQARSQPVRRLMVGQRGVGKTTELCWLAENLKAHGMVAYRFDLGQDPPENIGSAVTNLAIQLAGRSFIDDDRVEGLRQAKTTIGIDNLGRQYLNTDVGKAVRLLSEVVRVLQQVDRDPILLIDGWERLGSDAPMFSLMRILEQINCSVILVSRLSTIFISQFDPFREEWQLVILPSISVYTEGRAAVEAGWSLLKSVLERRTAEKVFWDSGALQQIIPLSGGNFRELVTMGQHASLLAGEAGKIVITAVEAESAIRQQRLRHTPTLSPDDQSVLRGFASGNRNVLDGSLLEQVNKSRIVAYHDQHLWFDVHPLLWPLVGLSYPEPPWGYR
jgi:hypothetical protein